MAKYIKCEAVLELIRPDDPNDERCAVTVATAKRLIRHALTAAHAADVTPVVHGRCPICSGRKILTQDCDNGYSVEVDAEQGEMSIWEGDTCLAVMSIDYCFNCGAKMDGGDGDEAD